MDVGLNDEYFKMMFEEISANNARLNNCKRHHFPTFPERLTLGAKLDCCKCGGQMDAVEAAAYTRGYVAGGGNGDDIIPHWNG